MKKIECVHFDINDFYFGIECEKSRYCIVSNGSQSRCSVVLPDKILSYNKGDYPSLPKINLIHQWKSLFNARVFAFKNSIDCINWASFADFKTNCEKREVFLERGKDIKLVSLNTWESDKFYGVKYNENKGEICYTSHINEYSIYCNKSIEKNRFNQYYNNKYHYIYYLINSGVEVFEFDSVTEMCIWIYGS